MEGECGLEPSVSISMSVVKGAFKLLLHWISCLDRVRSVFTCDESCHVEYDHSARGGWRLDLRTG